MTTRSVLLIDDEPNMRWVLGKALEQAGYTVHTASAGDEGLSLLAREPIDLILLDLKLRGEDGLTVLRRIRERAPEVVVLMFTAYGTVPTAVEAMQLGAADFLRKPFDVEEILFKIARSLERRAMQQELARLSAAQRQVPAFGALVGAAPSWQQTISQAQQLAELPQDVVVVGEPGSGRDSLARAIHTASSRAGAPLVELDLALYTTAAQTAALTHPDGVWGMAGIGTLVVRNLEAAAGAQAALTIRLAERQATGGPRLLLITVSDETLPPVLAEALPLRLRVPPLRERPGDGLLLAAHQAGDRPITPAAQRLVEQYPWPGNGAEVRAAITRAARLAGDSPIDVEHLPAVLQRALAAEGPYQVPLPPGGILLEQVEQDLIRQALELARGNKSRAAELLGLTRHTLIYRMEKYGIVPRESGETV
ncbi:MAG TPA: response regulator [Roseiflexaceae bacterium]|nr:response regulator [Roseiflexaceae bacterium]